MLQLYAPSGKALRIIGQEKLQFADERTVGGASLQSKRTFYISFTDKHSPCNPLTLHIISRSASKAAIASAARFLLDEELRRRQNSYDVDHVGGYELPIPELNSILEGRFNL